MFNQIVSLFVKPQVNTNSQYTLEKQQAILGANMLIHLELRGKYLEIVSPLIEEDDTTN